jgi:hypothetical protein
MMNLVGGCVSRDEVSGLTKMWACSYVDDIASFQFWYPLLPLVAPLQSMTSSVRSLGSAAAPFYLGYSGNHTCQPISTVGRCKVCLSLSHEYAGWVLALRVSPVLSEPTGSSFSLVVRLTGSCDCLVQEVLWITDMDRPDEITYTSLKESDAAPQDFANLSGLPIISENKNSVD